jgi:hypothetical protein
MPNANPSNPAYEIHSTLVRFFDFLATLSGCGTLQCRSGRYTYSDARQVTEAGYVHRRALGGIS